MKFRYYPPRTSSSIRAAAPGSFYTAYNHRDSIAFDCLDCVRLELVLNAPTFRPSFVQSHDAEFAFQASQRVGA